MASTRSGMAGIVGLSLVLAAGVMLSAAHDRRGIFATAGASQAGGGGSLALDAPIPEFIPPGVTLRIGDPITQRVLEHTGWIRDLPFIVKWAQITGGPAVTEAFHARALDVGLAADMPPIHATWVGLPVKIIAVRLREDPRNHPLYVLAVAPGSNIHDLAELRGRRIAFSPGQVQGEVVLRALRAAHLSTADVKLVELPSTGADVYINAMVGGAIDAAPIAAGAASKHYLDNYGAQGARLIRHGDARDDLTDLYVRTETLRDPGQAAALRAYVRLWARANAWIATHPEEWERVYYEGNQGLSPADARYVTQVSGRPVIPRHWDEAIALEQSTIDLMASETRHARFDAATLFDRRFETVAADAIGSRSFAGSAVGGLSK